MKRFLFLLKIAVLCGSILAGSLLLAGCDSGGENDIPAVENTGSETGKLQIVATLFPQYDFARQIAGDKADVTLLLPPGMESHSYEPKPSDIIKIDESDVFLYTGKYMEPWSQKIVDSMKDSSSGSGILDVTQGIDLIKTEEEEAGHIGSDESESAGEEHDHLYDPHVWTDPVNAKAMVSNISEALCKADPVNADYYRKNAETYRRQLDALDAEFKSIMASGKRKEIIFGSRFALYYFSQRYGLDYEAAFDSCSAETEPSAKTIAALIGEIREKKIPVVYYAEIEDPKVAKSISAETGAKLLLFHSCHNITKEELEGGATYLSLMKQNAENLKEGLE